MIVRIVLVEPEGSVNLGFIARLCVNFSVDELYLVNPKASIEEALEYASKARDFLLNAVIRTSINEAIENVDLVIATTGKGSGRGDYLRQAISLKDFISLLKQRSPGSIAILFGRESTGLTREELSLADYLVTIPANPRYPILNLGHAVAIMLYELFVFRKTYTNNIPPRASKDQIIEIYKLIDELAIKVVHRDKAYRISRVLKTVIGRGMPSEYEARQIMYLLRKVLRKIG